MIVNLCLRFLVSTLPGVCASPAVKPPSFLSPPPQVCEELGGQGYSAVKALLEGGGPICGCLVAQTEGPDGEDEFVVVPELMGGTAFATCRWSLGFRGGRVMEKGSRRQFYDSTQLKIITTASENTV